MRELFLMWRRKRMVGLTIAIAIAYTITLLPFKQLALLPGFSTIRPANVLPVVFGLMFGPAAAWGSLLGNLAGDLLGGTWSAGSYFGAVGNFFTAFVVYRLWGNLGSLSTGQEPDLSTGDQFPEYLLVSFTAGCVTAAIIGWGHEVVTLVPFPIIGLTIVFNNTLAELFLGPPLLYLLFPRIKRRGLLYYQLLSDRSLPEPNALQRPAAVALVVLSIGWVIAGSAYGIVVEGITQQDIIGFQTLQAAGSIPQVAGGGVLFVFVGGASLLAGERLSVIADREQDPVSLQELDRIRRHMEIGVFALVSLGLTLAALYVIAVGARIVETPVSLPTLMLQLGMGVVLPAMLLAGGLWLHRTDYGRDRIWRIALWSFGGLGTVTVLSAWQFYHILLGVPAGSAVIEGFLLNVQAGAVGGFIVGAYDLRAQLTSEALKRERDKLQRENERLNEFAGIVSHDLRNPLNVASGRLRLARAEQDSEHLRAVEEAHDRMETLIEDVLTLAREGGTVSDVEPIDLADVLETCWLTVQADEATLQVQTDRVIEADLGRLQQLIENLFRNAIEHGGEDVTVTVGNLGDGFYVEDDGPGIPQEERDAVFETGYTTGEGTGFGLSIVDQIATAHGWDVTITESDGGGVRFEFTGIETMD